MDRIEGWLEELDLALKEEEEQEREPVTPKTRTVRREENSPTETTFSAASVFDSSVSDIPRPDERGRDTGSETSSISSDAKEKGPPTTLDSLEKIVDEDTQKTAPAAKAKYPPLDLCYITLLPCIHCAFASLPCSLTLPTCSRCVRNSTPCIFLRHRLPWEVNCTGPVLLRLNEDSEKMWQEKLREVEKMRLKEEERRDRANWVMPRVDVTVRGGWRKGRDC